jgi:hypothetical protein
MPAAGQHRLRVRYQLPLRFLQQQTLLLLLLNLMLLLLLGLAGAVARFQYLQVR